MNSFSRPCLVDTNVAVVANGRSPQADDKLVENCIDAIVEITNQGGLVIDSDDRIFEEYRDNLSMTGQPGTGDAFMKWVHDHRWQVEFCERRDITCTDENNQLFQEFPTHHKLTDFDVDDRKFIAVANAGTPSPILQAVDFKWWGWKDALADVGLQVVFLDEIAAEAGYRKHMGHV